MFNKVNLAEIGHGMLEHIILSNFGHLLGNTKEDNIDLFNLNMQYLTSYLVSTNKISKNELIEIIQKLEDDSKGNNYGMIPKYKTDLLVNHVLVFRLSKIISLINPRFFFNSEPKIFKLFKLDKWFRIKIANKAYIDIYEEFFNYHKSINQIDFQTYNKCELTRISYLLKNAVDSIEYSKLK